MDASSSSSSSMPSRSSSTAAISLGAASNGAGATRSTGRRRTGSNPSSPFIAAPPMGYTMSSSPPETPVKRAQSPSDLGEPPPYSAVVDNIARSLPASRTRTPSPVTHRRSPTHSRAPSRSPSSSTVSALSSLSSNISVPSRVTPSITSPSRSRPCSPVLARGTARSLGTLPKLNRTESSEYDDNHNVQGVDDKIEDGGLYIRVRRRRTSLPSQSISPKSPSETETETEIESAAHRPISTNAPMTETEDDTPPMQLPTTRRRKAAGGFPYSFSASLAAPPSSPLTSVPPNSDATSKRPKRRRYRGRDPMLVLQDLELTMKKAYSFVCRLVRLLSSPSALLFGPAKTRTALDVLFGLCRLLSVVPGMMGALHVVFWVQVTPGWTSFLFKEQPEARICRVGTIHPLDIIPALLFIMLTAYQCLALTSGLLFRWRMYYPPLATLVRVLALQVICWSATHSSVTLLGVASRPHVVWALVATFTSFSRSVQMWVTSNLWRKDEMDVQVRNSEGEREAHRWRGGRWRGRRWDWGAVTRRCILPLGVGYFVMAWAGVGARVWC